MFRPTTPYRQTSISSLFRVLKDNYDSLPSVNTRTSLPVNFVDFVTFPNYRRSFLQYVSKHTSEQLDKMSEYDRYIETSPYPYGYEFEECFLKHNNRLYRQGKNQLDFVVNHTKCIEAYTHLIHIKYVKKSNTFIVTSTFDKKHRQVFFKQTNKLIAEVDGEIKWNSYNHLPFEFRKGILSHIQNIDGKLHTALSSISTANRDFRTVLNNPFWKETQATFLLNRSHKKLKRTCQYHFKRNKDYFTVNNLFDGIPEDIANQLKTIPSFTLDQVPEFKVAYDFLVKEVPELATFEFLSDRFWSLTSHARTTYSTDPEFIKYIKEYKNEFKSLSRTVSNYLTLVREVETLNNSFNYPHTLKNYQGSFKDLAADAHFFKNNISTKGLFDKKVREVVVLKDKSEVIFNPTLKEILKESDSNVTISVNKEVDFEYLIYNGTVYASSSDFIDACSLGFIMQNSDTLKTKIPDITSVLNKNSTPSRKPQVSPSVWGSDDLPF